MTEDLFRLFRTIRIDDYYIKSKVLMLDYMINATPFVARQAAYKACSKACASPRLANQCSCDNSSFTTKKERISRYFDRSLGRQDPRGEGLVFEQQVLVEGTEGPIGMGDGDLEDPQVGGRLEANLRQRAVIVGRVRIIRQPMA